MNASAATGFRTGTAPLSSCALAIAVGLGLALGGALPRTAVLPVLGTIPTVLAVVVLLHPSRRVLPAMVGGCIIATTLASSTLPALPDILTVGRFVFPVMVILLVISSGTPIGSGPTGQRLRRGYVLLLAPAVLSAATSTAPSLSAMKVLSFALVLASTMCAVQWFASHDVPLRRPLVRTLTVLAVSNLLFLPLGAAAYSGDRFRGWTINPNTLGIVCALGLPLLAAEIVTSRGRRRSLAVAAAVVVALMLVLTGSRGGALAALVGVVAVLRSARVTRKAMFPIIAASLVLIAPGAFRSASQADFLEGVNRRGSSGRETVWAVAMNEIRQRPLSGAGFATSESRFSTAEFGRLDVFQGSHFHSSYLEAAVELGVLGTVPLLLVGLFSLSRVLRPPPPDQMWAAGVAVAGATVALFETGALTAGAVMFFPFWLAVGGLYAQRNSEGKSAIPLSAASLP